MPRREGRKGRGDGLSVKGWRLCWAGIMVFSSVSGSVEGEPTKVADVLSVVRDGDGGASGGHGAVGDDGGEAVEVESLDGDGLLPVGVVVEGSAACIDGGREGQAVEVVEVVVGGEVFAGFGSPVGGGGGVGEAEAEHHFTDVFGEVDAGGEFGAGGIGEGSSGEELEHGEDADADDAGDKGGLDEGESARAEPARTTVGWNALREHRE